MRWLLAFSLQAGWPAYEVLVQQWEGETYSPAADKSVVVGHGPLIVLRQALRKDDQDIPILVFTRAQWDSLHQDKLWPSLYAGGAMEELWHNGQFVFGISSRYNSGELKGWEEVARLVEQNRAADNMPKLYLE